MEKSSNNVVIEFGSSFLRGGFAGDNCPLFTIPTPNLDLKLSNRTELRIRCLEIFRSIFLDHLQVKSKDSQVLIVEQMFTPKSLREEIFHVLFQEMQVQMVSFQPDLMMACLASGSKSGIVLDISANECRCLAIAFGTPILSSVTTTSVGVSSAEEFFQEMYRSYCTSHDLFLPSSEGVSDLFSRVACISPTCLSVDGVCWNDSSHQHLPVDVSELPAKDLPSSLDKRVVLVPGWMRSSCLLPLVIGSGHPIFQPADALNADSVAGLEDEIGGAVGAVLTCLLKCNSDLRKYLLQHLVICGGGAALPGVARTICAALTNITSGAYTCNDHRFSFLSKYSDLSTLSCGLAATGSAVPEETIMSLWTPSIFDRDTFAWIGGSLFGAIKGNRTRYVSREEYLLTSSSPQPRVPITKYLSEEEPSCVSSSLGQTEGQWEQKLACRVPDWMSLAPADWRFYGSTDIQPAPLSAAKTVSTKGPWNLLKAKQKLKASPTPSHPIHPASESLI